jgi:hypothetical protein
MSPICPRRRSREAAVAMPSSANGTIRARNSASEAQKPASWIRQRTYELKDGGAKRAVPEVEADDV